MTALSSRPIFIGGDGRSGTTLLSLLLDSHGSLVVGPELHFRGPEDLGPSCLAACDLMIAEDPRTRQPELRNHPEIKREVQFVKRCHRFGLSPAELRSIVERQMRATGSDLREFHDRCRLIDALGRNRLETTGKRRWGIKIMRDIGIPNRYAEVWPEAQFVHIIRDGRDVAASQMREHGTWGYGDIENAARSWVRIIQNARKHAPAGSLIEVRYENLVLDLEKTLTALCAFLGVEFEPFMLRHNEVDHSLYENPYSHPSFKQAAQAVNASAVGRYRRDLAAEEIALFDEIVADAGLAEFAPPSRI